MGSRVSRLLRPVVAREPFVRTRHGRHTGRRPSTELMLTSWLPRKFRIEDDVMTFEARSPDLAGEIAEVGPLIDIDIDIELAIQCPGESLRSQR